MNAKENIRHTRVSLLSSEVMNKLLDTHVSHFNAVNSYLINSIRLNWLSILLYSVYNCFILLYFNKVNLFNSIC